MTKFNDNGVLFKYDQPISIKECINQLRNEPGDWIYVVIDGSHYVINIKGMHNTLDIMIKMCEDISHRREQNFSNPLEYDKDNYSNSNITQAGRFKIKPLITEGFGGQSLQVKLHIIAQIERVRGLVTDHLIPLNIPWVSRAYDISIQINGKRSRFGVNGGYCQKHLNYDNNGITEMSYSDMLPDIRYVQLLNADEPIPQENVQGVIYIAFESFAKRVRFAGIKCSSVPDSLSHIPLKRIYEEIMKIRNIANDYSVCGETFTHLISIGSLWLTQEAKPSDDSKSSLYVDAKPSNDSKTHRKIKTYSNNFGIFKGPFIEYDMNSAYSYIAYKEFPNCRDFIKLMFEGKQKCDEDFKSTWKLSINATIARSTANSLGKSVQSLTREYVMSKIERLKAIGIKTALSVVDSIVVREDPSKVLNVGDGFGEFKVKNANVPWTFNTYRSLDSIRRPGVGKYYGTPLIPRGCLFCDLILVVIDSHDNNVYIGPINGTTKLKQSIRHIGDLQPLNDTEIYIVKEAIKPYVLSQYKDIAGICNFVAQCLRTHLE